MAMAEPSWCAPVWKAGLPARTQKFSCFFSISQCYRTFRRSPVVKRITKLVVTLTETFLTVHWHTLAVPDGRRASRRPGVQEAVVCAHLCGYACVQTNAWDILTKIKGSWHPRLRKKLTLLSQNIKKKISSFVLCLHWHNLNIVY